jgi:hypothetical protein
MSMPGGKDKTSQRCGGPPDQVYFPYEGIYIAVGIERSTLNPSFGIDVYVPAERVAQLKSDLAELIVDTNNGQLRTQVRLVPLNSKYRGFLKSATDPMVGKTWKQKYQFHEEERHQWYPFTSPEGRLEIKGDSGALLLPDFYVNGVLHPGPRVPFQKSHEFQLESLNC